MLTAMQAADILGMSADAVRLADSTLGGSRLFAHFHKIANQRVIAIDKAKSKRMKTAAVKRTLEAADRKEKRRPLVAHHAGKRRAAKIQRTPVWADHDAIRAVYVQAKAMTDATGIVHHVDHEIPLRGKRVSGLHVENNLRVIPAIENIKKHNSYEDSNV